MVLAIDQGTTGTTVLVVDPEGRVRGRAYGEIRQFYPRPGWVEHDPQEIYRSAVALCRLAMARARVGTERVAAAGISNQRETFVVWERRTGNPVGRAIVWQCRRSASICERLRGREPEIAARTGLVVDPYFSASKLKWLLDRDRSLRRRAARGELCFGTIESWLIFRLSGGRAFVTDLTNAARTMLFNLRRCQWDSVLLRMFDVPAEMLARPVAPRGPLAEVAAGVLGPRPVPIGAAIGDQQAALFGHRATSPGQTKVTYGTGAFLLTHTGQTFVASRNRLLSTIALGLHGEPAYALEGSVFMAGAVVQWLRDGLGLLRNARESEQLARQSTSRGEPYLVPAFVGLGAPYWDSGARGALLGVTRGTSRADVVRAALDSIAYQVCDVLGAMEKDTGRRIREISADGGTAANDYLMQFQADVAGTRIRRTRQREMTAYGAALLAGMAVGLWRSADDLAGLDLRTETFTPSMTSAQRKRLLAGWYEAVSRVRSQRQAPRR